MFIEGNRINLRRIAITDYTRILKWQKNKMLTYLIGNRLPMSIKECEKRYSKNSKLFNQIFGIEDKKGNLIGEIEIDHITWKSKQAELFLYIGCERLWGMGYGYSALKTFLEYIFREKKFKYIYLRVYENNERAIKCYNKCGFKKRGILKFNKGKIDSDNIVLMDIKPKDICK